MIELLVVLGILGVLAAAVMPLAQITAQREKERELRRALWELRDAIDAYRKVSGAALSGPAALSAPCPPTLQALVDGTPDPAKPGQTIHFLRRIPRDPFAPAEQPASDTWALRTYQSPASQPRPGADVYDVASKSDLVGLNGIPLKDW